MRIGNTPLDALTLGDVEINLSVLTVVISGGIRLHHRGT